MRDNLVGATVRVIVFLVVCALFLFALLAVFAQLRFQDENTYRADFTNVSGLKEGNFVRIAGVEVGKVTNVSISRDATALVEFTADESVVLTDGSRAVIRYDDLIGGRYLALEEGEGSSNRLPVGGKIPIERTKPALDLDALIGGFRPLFRALNPEQVNVLSTQLIEAFQGEGATINSFFQQTASLTSTLADRDQLIQQVIVNLNSVLGSVGDQDKQFAKAVESLSSLVGTLAGRKQEISDVIAYGDAAASSFTDLLSKARPPLQKTVQELDRTAGIVVADHEYFNNLLATLPDAYRAVGRLGIFGDYFSFYLCEAVLKVNGKGGQPVYVKLAGQSSGRCTPK